MTEITYPKNSNQHSVVSEPAMVMGFLPSVLHEKLRRMASEMGVSEAHLVSRFVREAVLKDNKPRRELQ